MWTLTWDHVCVWMYPGPCWAEWPASPPMAIVSTVPSLHSRVMSESVTVLQRGSVLIFITPMLKALSEVWTVTWDHTVVQEPPFSQGSTLMTMAFVAPKGHKDPWLLEHQLWPCWSLRDMPLQGPCRPEGQGLRRGPWYWPEQSCCREPCLALWKREN